MMKIRILFCGVKHPYGKPEFGLSYEYIHFFDTLSAMKKVEVVEFDWLAETSRYGRERMNQRLVERVDEYKPDLVFFSIVGEEFERETIRLLGSKTRTFNWFFDELGRFESFTRHWAACFSWIVTAMPELVEKYKALGCRHVLQMQMGSNPRVYKNLGLEKLYDVSFVGMAHSNRKRLVAEIEKSGILVAVWGDGWGRGRVSQAEIVRIFNQSKINLNFTAISFDFPWGKHLPWFLQPRQFGAGNYLINGRIFEIPCTGSFLLTHTAAHLTEYYVPGKEIGVFDSVAGAVDRIQYYLSHEREREQIALAGYRRTLQSYTYEEKFRVLFKKMGLF